MSSRSSTASYSPVDAPEGTSARPTAPDSSSTSTSTVGLPRESRICRAETSMMVVIARGLLRRLAGVGGPGLGFAPPAGPGRSRTLSHRSSGGRIRHLAGPHPGAFPLRRRGSTERAGGLTARRRLRRRRPRAARRPDPAPSPPPWRAGSTPPARQVERRPVRALGRGELRRRRDAALEAAAGLAQRELGVHVQQARHVDGGEEQVADLVRHARVGAVRVGAPRLGGGRRPPRRRSAAPPRRTARPARRAPRRSWGTPRRPSPSRSRRWRRAAAASWRTAAPGTRPARRGRCPAGPPAPP